MCVYMAGFSDFNLRSVRGSRSEMLSVVGSRDFNETSSPDTGCRRGKCIRKKICMIWRGYSAERKVAFVWTFQLEVGEMRASSFGRIVKKNKVVFVRAEVETRDGWTVTCLEKPLSISRYWTRNDTRAATNYRVPSYLFAQLFPFVALTLFRILEISRNPLLELTLPALIYLRATIQIFISRNIA